LLEAAFSRTRRCQAADRNRWTSNPQTWLTGVNTRSRGTGRHGGEACGALEAGVCGYRFVRRYLERNPQLPLSLRQVDPLIRQLCRLRLQRI
jgi:hypothetical protein